MLPVVACVALAVACGPTPDDGPSGGACPSSVKADTLACQTPNGGTTVLEQGLVNELVIHGSDLYVASSEQITRVPLSGGAPQVLVSGSNTYGLIVLGESAYFKGYRPQGEPDPQGKQPMVSTLETIPLSGGVPSVVLENPPGMSAASTASDETSIYFASTGSGGVGKLTPPATTLEELPLLEKFGGMRIALACGSVFVAGVDYGDPSGPTSAIQRISTDGGAAEAIATGLRPMSALAVDESGVYFAESGDWKAIGRLARAKHDGSDVTTLVETEAIAIALSEDRVYFATFDGIQSIDKSGGTPTKVTAGKSPGILRRAGQNLVWVEPSIKGMSDPTVPLVKTTCIP